MVAAINEKLAAAGVGRAPRGDCPAVAASVERAADGILVRIEDPSGRTSERLVTGPAAAAALIESWTRSDVSLGLLDGRAAPIPASAPVAVTAPTETRSEPPEPPVPPRDAGGRLALGGEVSAGIDGSTWFGGRFGGCGEAGPTCVGGLVRGGYDPALTGESAASGTLRGGLDLLFTLDFPVQWDGFALAPGVGVGGGWVRSTASVVADGEEQQGQHDDDDNDDEDGDESSSGQSSDSLGLRVEAHLGGAVRLTDWLTLDLGIGLGWSTHNHAESFDARGAALAGEPALLFRGSVGLGYEFR